MVSTLAGSDMSDRADWWEAEQSEKLLRERIQKAVEERTIQAQGRYDRA